MSGNVERILIYRVGSLGDAVIAIPAVRAVRAVYPNAKITLLTGRNINGYVVANDVLPANLLDDCITYSQDGGATDPRKLLKLLPILRKRRFDLLVYLPARLRTEWTIRRDLIFFRMAGIRRVIGQGGREPVGRRAPGAPLRVLEHEADYLLARIAAGGVPVPAKEDRRIDLDLTTDEMEAARHFLLARSVPLDGFPVAMAPGTKWPSKKWPEENFFEVGARLIAQYNAFPVIFGGREDAEIAHRLLQKWGTGINTAGELTVRQSAAALSFCRLFVGNDSGPIHLAAAVGVPAVGVYASIDYPGRWSPYGKGHIAIRHDVDCAGCMLSVCEAQQMRCIKSITVDEVMAACRQSVPRPSLSEAARKL